MNDADDYDFYVFYVGIAGEKAVIEGIGRGLS